jgi:isoleucyl-tRNA synthetase
MFVALDTTLTPELIEAGIARELVNRIQAMRKAAGFHVSDRIALTLNGSAKALAAFQSHKGYVTGETLAVRVEAVPGPNAFVKQHTLGGEQVTVSVERVVHQ